MTPNNGTITHLAVPKGRIEPAVTALLAAAGMELRAGPRGYRPVLSVPGYEVKLLKPQNIVEMLAAGTRDVGFAGADWVAEKSADLVELLDTGLDPVRMVAAAPESLLVEGEPSRQAPGRRRRVRAADPGLDRLQGTGRDLRPLIRGHRGVPTRRRRCDRGHHGNR